MSCSLSDRPLGAWLAIDLAQLHRNLRHLKCLAAPARLGIALKANGYGHGLEAVGRTAEQAEVDLLCLARVEEALLLRQAGITRPMLLMGAFDTGQVQAICSSGVEVSIGSTEQARLLEAACATLGRPVRIHVEVDTGMQRTGMRPTEALDWMRQIDRYPHLLPVGISTHFATADCPGHPETQRQWETFVQLLAHPRVMRMGLTRHSANSAAFLHVPEARLDLVRIGLLAYGVDPLGRPLPEGIAPCLNLKARVTVSKTVRAGEGISYGHRTIVERDTRVVTVPVGYGDGYPRQMFPGGCVLIRGKRFPIVGNICMDQLMVDVGQELVEPGEEVVLLGAQGEAQIDAHELAQRSGTIAWDILCRWTERLPRSYSG